MAKLFVDPAAKVNMMRFQSRLAMAFTRLGTIWQTSVFAPAPLAFRCPSQIEFGHPGMDS
ncbi:MAG TPA: hypothetical protein VHS96_10180 [Bacteroidia bacterium]|nr:hypothetical protein [Bacteroidia bacterium]